VPTAMLSGGAVAYLDSLLRQADYVRATYSVPAQGLPALAANLATTVSSLAWGLGLFALPVVAVAAAGAHRAIRARRVVLDPVDQFLVLWTLPALALYVVLHIGEWGYVLSVLPGLYVLASLGLARLSLPRLALMRTAVAVGVAASALLFVAGQAPFSADAIARHDSELTAWATYVRAHYSPRSTLVLAREDFLLVRYYLPEFRAWLHDPDPYRLALRRKRANNVSAIVVFTHGLRAASAEARRVECAKGVQLVYLDIEPGSIVELYGDRYTIADAAR
ncbi:MAG TPA: hypothetical protein VGQ86_10730, partial [Candidatus Limnocylindria bacterium]|nr:hypothetical protein [Candidatus Limnocylindria bacterium]